MIKESANWTYNDAPIVTSERLTRARLSWCSNALLRLGCTIPGGCRLSLAETVLAAIDADKSAIENADGRAKVAEVQRMAWEFTVILVAAVNTRLDANPFTVAKLEQMLGGPLVPTGGEDHSRDTQFELYVPALFSLGGVNVHPGPPDAKVTILGETLGLEARRVSTLNAGTLRGHLRKASRQAGGAREMGQLEIVQHRGIIAVNVDVYFSDLHPSQGPVDLIGQFQHRLEILDIAAKVLSDKPAIVGLLACGFVAGWDRSENGWRYDVLYPTRWMSLHGDDPVDVKLAKRLAQTLERMQYRAREIEAQVPKPRSF